MALIVQKYGGTSVGDPARILNVARRVIETQQAGNQVVVVLHSCLERRLCGIGRRFGLSKALHG